MCLASDLLKRSDRETTTDFWSKVIVAVIGDAGPMRNGDGQTTAHIGIRNSGKGGKAHLLEMPTIPPGDDKGVGTNPLSRLLLRGFSWVIGS